MAAEILKFAAEPKSGPSGSGPNWPALKIKADNARVAIAAPHPTREQAINLTTKLVSAFTDADFLPDARLEAIANIFTRFPLPVVERCAHEWDGIARTKIPDGKGGLQPRRKVPATGEIIDWCEAYQADLWQLARAGENAEAHPRNWRPGLSSRSPPEPKAPPSAEDIAHVWAKVAEFHESTKRVLGLPTAEEQRDCAARILEAARCQAEARPPAAGADGKAGV